MRLDMVRHLRSSRAKFQILECSAGPPFFDEILERREDVVDHRGGQARIQSDPEHIPHDKVGVRQLASDAELYALISRLPDQIPAEQEPGSNLACIQMPLLLFIRSSQHFSVRIHRLSVRTRTPKAV